MSGICGQNLQGSRSPACLGPYWGRFRPGSILGREPWLPSIVTYVSLLLSASGLTGQGSGILGIQQGLEAQGRDGEWGGWGAAVHADRR